MYDCGGNRLHGCYHHLKQDQYLLMEADLTTHNHWNQQCTTANISAGFFVSIEGAGKGQCTFVNKRLGPFISTLKKQLKIEKRKRKIYKKKIGRAVQRVRDVISDPSGQNLAGSAVERQNLRGPDAPLWPPISPKTLECHCRCPGMDSPPPRQK